MFQRHFTTGNCSRLRICQVGQERNERRATTRFPLDVPPGQECYRGTNRDSATRKCPREGNPTDPPLALLGKPMIEETKIIQTTKESIDPPNKALGNRTATAGTETDSRTSAIFSEFHTTEGFQPRFTCIHGHSHFPRRPSHVTLKQRSRFHSQRVPENPEGACTFVFMKTRNGTFCRTICTCSDFPSHNNYPYKSNPTTTKRPIPMSSRTKVYLSGREEEMINELKAFVCLCSMKLFDRWNNVVHLHLDKMNITSDVYSLLAECLELPLAKDPAGSSAEKRRWIQMTMQNIHFTNNYIFNEGGDYIDKNQAQRLCSAIADRALRLKITRSEGFLTTFLDTPKIEHLSVDTLHIEEGDSLSAQQYAKLGKLIASTVQLLRDLYLSVAVADGAQELFDGLANAINLRKLTLYDCDSTDTDSEDSTRNSPAAELIIGCNSPLIRLLQNPLNQLKELSLSKLGLNDQHLITLSQALPTCQIELFDVSHNLIESDGMLEFARQLPRMHSLKHVRFGSNPWVESETTSNTIGAALLQGIMENTSIESMDRDGLCRIPQGLLVLYYLVLNRAGRRLLVSSQTIPDGLWPLVLERAGNVKRYKGIDDMFGDSSSNRKCDDSSRDEKCDDLSSDEKCDDSSSDEKCDDSSSDENCDDSSHEKSDDSSSDETCDDLSSHEKSDDSSSHEKSVDSRTDKKATARYNAVYFLCTSLQRYSPYCSKRQLEEREMPASKHPRLGTNDDEKSLRVDHLAPDEEHVPRWAQNMEQRLSASIEEMRAKMRVIEQQSQRALNRGIKRTNESLTLVIRLEDGRVPDDFPATIEELQYSDEERVDELLRFYGLPNNGTITEKKRSLRIFLGSNL